jgi:hypothetical protein
VPDRFQQRSTAARVGLLHRVIGVRRAQAPLPDDPARRAADRVAEDEAPEAAEGPKRLEPELAERLERRIAHLEAQVEDLQDALHRATLRQERHLEDVDHRLDPSVLARALSEDARRRGL